MQKKRCRRKITMGKAVYFFVWLVFTVVTAILGSSAETWDDAFDELEKPADPEQK